MSKGTGGPYGGYGAAKNSSTEGAGGGAGAGLGGAIFVGDGANVSLNQVTFTGNTVTAGVPIGHGAGYASAYGPATFVKSYNPTNSATYVPGSLTISGPVTMSDTLYVDGALHINGLLTYQGGALQVGTLTGSNVGNLQIQNNVSLTVTQGTGGNSFSGILSGNSLALTGGTFIFVDDSAQIYCPVTLSNSGTVCSGMGSSASGYPSIHNTVTVNGGTILSGSFTQINSVVVKSGGTDTATFAVGSSVGFATVDDITFEGSQTQLNIFVEPTLSSYLYVNNSLTIGSGAEVVFELAKDGFFPDGSLYEFLYYGMRTGTFSHVNTSAGSFLAGEIVYGDHNATVQLNYRPFHNAIHGNNAQSVAAALYRMLKEKQDLPLLHNLMPELLAGSLSQASSTLNQLQPAELKGMTVTQESNSVRVQDALSVRTQDLLDLQRCKVDCQKWNVWVNGFGDFLDQNDLHFAGSPQVGYNSTTGGALLGVDRTFGSIVSCGLLGAYTGSHLQFSQKQGTGSIDSGYAGLYLSATGKRFYVNASCIGSWSHFSEHRRLLLPEEHLTATSSHGGTGLLTHLDTGLNWSIGHWSLRPFDSLDLVTQSEGSFTEQGAGVFDLHVRSSSSTFLRNELGMIGNYCWCYRGVIWALSPKLSWVREVRPSGSHYTATFVNTSTPFQVSGYFPNRSLISPGLKCTASTEHWTCDLYYNGEWQMSHYNNQSVGAEVHYTF